MSIVDNAVCLDGTRRAVPETLDVTYETMAATGGVGWIGLYRPSTDEVASVAQEFSLHSLVVEDMIQAHQRPKIERYGDVLFTVLRPARYLDHEERLEFGELHVVIGTNFVFCGHEPVRRDAQSCGGSASAGGHTRPSASRTRGDSLRGLGSGRG